MTLVSGKMEISLLSLTDKKTDQLNLSEHMKNDSPHYLGHDMKSNLKVFPYRRFSFSSG